MDPLDVEVVSRDASSPPNPSDEDDGDIETLRQALKEANKQRALMDAAMVEMKDQLEIEKERYRKLWTLIAHNQQ